MIGSFFWQNTEQAAPSARAAFDEDAFLREGFSLRVEQVTRTEIQQGQASISLVQFAADDKPFMIRKRVKNERKEEISFMKGLCAPHDISRQVLRIDWPLPQVFHIAEAEEHTDIYMQYVAGISYPSARAVHDIVRPLAKAIYALSLVLPIICRTADLTLEHRGSPGGSFFNTVENLIPDSRVRLREIVRFQRQLPIIASHNDIYWPNMGIAPQADSANIIFIDFGMLGQNVVGAELHHFARVSIGSKRWSEFFHRICKHYSQYVRIMPAALEMNALFYAMVRLVAYDIESNQERVAELYAEVLTRYDALIGNK